MKCFSRVARSVVCVLMLITLCTAALHAYAAAEAQILYTGVMLRDMTVRSAPDRESAALGTVRTNEKIQIYDFSPEWLHIASKNGDGYVLRNQVRDIVALDPQATLPYGAVRHLQIAQIANNTALYKERQEGGDAWCLLTPGSYLSVWYIQDGWAVIPYHRGIGYVPAAMLTGLTPVSPTVEYAQGGDLLAAFTSFFDTKETELNSGRIVNIDVACKFISNVMQPGEKFSFNDVAGPYRRTRGYMPAPVLFEGTTTAGYGGGTCQVSTTLYNVLLQLPQGMNVLYRRPHGPSGAKYVPHGVDAAVGTETQNLIFQNDFPFPVRIFAYAQDGSLFVAIYKA